MSLPKKWNDGRLTTSDREKVLKWVNEKAPLVGKCPTCGHREWSLMEHFVHAPIFYGGGMLVGGPSYPFVGLVCANCGNSQFLNAVIIGLIPSIEPTPPGDDKKSAEANV